MSARTHYVNARRTLRKLLDWRIVPVINENDTTTTDEVSFGDNDFLAAQVAVLVGADLLVLLTDTGGLYTADPRVDPARELVDEVEDPEALGALEIGARDVAARLGRHALEGRGRRDGDRGRDRDRDRAPGSSRACSPRAWAGEAGRHALRARGPCASRASSCGSSTPSPRHGTRDVDAGAARALREGGTSLLPVGIVEVRGAFDAGDAVEVRDGGDGPIGKGICNYSAAELRQRDGPQVRRGARGAAARDRGSGPPGLLRARLDFPPWPSPPPVRHRDLPRRAGAPRARWRRMSSAAKDAALLRGRRRAGGARGRDPRGQRPRPRGGPRVGPLERADGPAGARPGADRARSPARVRAIAALPDPVGEVLDGLRLPERARRPQGARAARRHRRRLRGAAERHRRRRRAVPEVGQRDRAARLVDRRRTRTPCSPRSSSRRSSRDGAVSLVVAAAASSSPSWRARRASST